jgi:hypothetical protein
MGQRVNGNGEWNGRTRNDKCLTCLQDKSTTLKLIPMLQPKQLSFSPPTFYWNLNTIQENNSIFFFWQFSLLLFFFFFLRNLIPSLYFSFLLLLFYYFFFYNYNKNKMLPHTCLLVTTIQFPKQRTQEVTIIVLQTQQNKGEMMWVNKGNG